MRPAVLLTLAALLATSASALAQGYATETSGARRAHPYRERPPLYDSGAYEGRALAPGPIGPGGANMFNNGNTGIGGGPGIGGR